MIREAERGRGTVASLDKHELDIIDNYDFLDLLSHSETAFIFHGLNEENNACGNAMNSMLSIWCQKSEISTSLTCLSLRKMLREYFHCLSAKIIFIGVRNDK